MLADTATGRSCNMCVYSSCMQLHFEMLPLAYFSVFKCAETVRVYVPYYLPIHHGHRYVQ